MTVNVIPYNTGNLFDQDPKSNSAVRPNGEMIIDDAIYP
jgi:hypothetical protein